MFKLLLTMLQLVSVPLLSITAGGYLVCLEGFKPFMISHKFLLFPLTLVYLTVFVYNVMWLIEYEDRVERILENL